MGVGVEAGVNRGGLVVVVGSVDDSSDRFSPAFKLPLNTA